MGFTLYDAWGNITFDRAMVHTGFTQQDISVSSEIHEIVFSGSSDGFVGTFIVRDNHGQARTFRCQDCLSDSQTTDLNQVYIDSDMNGDRNLPNTANCQNSCRFVAGKLP